MGAAALVGFALFAAGAARVFDVAAATIPASVAVESRELRFQDEPDGSVTVLDASGNRLVATLAPGTNGFARALLRGFARERKRRGIGPELPFRLSVSTPVGLLLEDPATGRIAALQAFGPTNADVFANFLPSRSQLQ